VISCPHCAGVGTVEATDLFCGAGGSSLGLEFVRCPHCGRQLVKVTQALNHWDLAVQAHNENFPDADHDLHDVEVVPAWRFRRTPILWASPECVHHAYCRGRKSDDESAERSRMTMNDVFRFTEYHRYDAVIVENVIEARLWEPFDDWFRAICDLGYEGETVFFNSQFALPTPQSRDRMYCVFWRKGLKRPMLDFQPRSWCSNCERVVQGIQWWKKASPGSSRTEKGKFMWGRYGQQYTYACPYCLQNVAPAVVGAKSIIDWSMPMVRIGDKPRPLAPKTRQRIKTGLERLQTTRPVAVQVGGNLFERQGYARVWSVDDPLRTVTGSNYMSLVVPAHDNQQLSLTMAAPNGNGHPRTEMLIRVNRGGDRRPLTLDEPVPTVAGHGEMALVSFRNHGDAERIELPARAVTAGGSHHGLLVYNGNPGFVRSLEDATGTVTGRDKQSLLVPTDNGNERGRPLVISEDDIDDCLFRMLQWPELLAAQQMHMKPDGTPYRLEARRRNKRGKMVELSNELRVRMIGNAVSSPVATMLGNAVVDSLMAA
jgi:DNA (cytosine-5)-methyltransferase 1